MKVDLEEARRTLEDWPNLSRYRPANARLSDPGRGEERVVFLGDSITDGWQRRWGKAFPKAYVNRGIKGQTTPQMLIRFRPDVVDLKPKVVVILAGTNDLYDMMDSTRLAVVKDNLTSMAELAKANGIRVVLASLLPICDSRRQQTIHRSPATIVALNQWIQRYAAQNGFVYLDYYSDMVDPLAMLNEALTDDCLHPNDNGYAVMEPLAAKAVAEALAANGSEQNLQPQLDSPGRARRQHPSERR